MPVDCSPRALVDLSKCLLCLDRDQRDAIKTYLLTVIAGVPLDIGALVNASRCLLCLSPIQLKAIQANLLCQINNGGVVPATCENLEGADADPNGIVTPDFIGQNYQSGNTIWNATDLTNSGWVLICTNEGGEECGIVWGPTPTDLPMIGMTSFNSIIFGGITTLEFPKLQTVGSDVQLGSESTVQSIKFPSLVSIAGELNTINDSALTVLELPLLQSLVLVTVTGCSALLVFSLPQLATVTNALNADNLLSVTSINLPLLTSVAGAGLNLGAASVVTSINLDSLQSVNGAGHVVFDACLLLTSLSLPALTTVNGNFSASSCFSLVSFSAPNWIPTDGTTIAFDADALNAASVQLILRRCVLAGVVACNINLSGGTNAGTASLNAQGQADVATLGAQVTMNP